MTPATPSTFSTRTNWSTAMLRERSSSALSWAFPSTGLRRRSARRRRSRPGRRRRRHFCDRWARGSHRDRSPDRRVRIVALEREILVAEAEEILHFGIEPHARQRPRRAQQLLLRLFEMIEVEVRVAQRVHEFPGLQVAD